MSVAGQDPVIEPCGQEVARITNPEATHLGAKIALNGPEGWKVDYDGVHQILPRMRFLFVCRAVPKANGETGLSVALLRDCEPNSARLLKE
ncbi:MAG: hypothetical protein ACREIA_11545 [Opitutaceae bacterium]